MTAGDVYAWRARRERERSRAPSAHYHGCPECFEYHACLGACATEPDLGTHRGAPIGHHCACARCAKVGDAS